ncbi:MAG TPA: thioredoxin [bacterium]|nr:thioredoxin [bacterium]
MKNLFPVLFLIFISGCLFADKKPVFYFFHSENCPHCIVAKPFIKSLEEKYPEVEFKNLEVSRNLDAKELYMTKIEELKIGRGGVPLFVLEKDYVIGFRKGSHEKKIEKMIEELLKKFKNKK